MVRLRHLCSVNPPDEGADHIAGGQGDDTLLGNGLYWTHWDNAAHDCWSRSSDGLDDGDTIYGGQNAGAWLTGKTRFGTVHLRKGHDTLQGGPGGQPLDHRQGHTGAGHADHVHVSSTAAGDVVYGLGHHDVLWFDGAIATQDQVAALGDHLRADCRRLIGSALLPAAFSRRALARPRLPAAAGSGRGCSRASR